MISQPFGTPQATGVYIFRKGRSFLYIGKAANLKKRLAYYFRKNTSQKIQQLLQEATSLDWIETSSEIEAFLKEAELIKKYHPKYNIVMRDDKNYFYVGLTKEKFPRVFTAHQLFKDKASYIGPFTSGASLKLVLKLLRRIFPYCTCKTTHKRPCLNSQIGRCPGFCCDKNKLQAPNPKLQNEYRSNIKKITAILSGGKKGLLPKLKKEMKAAAKNQDFERAVKLRDQLSGLENIFRHRPFLADYRGETSVVPWAKIEQELRVLVGSRKSILRAEGYDISNISGREATGSMVVFTDGQPVKSEYRKFRIKTVNQISDVGMLKEVIGRRLNHPEWPYPDLMLIDGGKAQLNVAQAVLRSLIHNSKFMIPVFALAKREEELYTENNQNPIKLSSLPPPVAFFLQRVRDEAHRFARSYHHKLRQQSFSESHT